MVKPVRYTSQKQQELMSRHQLCERLVEFGWVPNTPEDLGEDFVVHIYFQGRATGVIFHIQEKSVTNLNERRKNGHLVYDFEVRDLRHWKNFSLPVVLIVWDIELREGRWALVDQAITDLEQRHPEWRKNKKARVYIPWENTTDDAGLVKLKQSIGQHCYPLIAKDKPLEKIELKVSFPNTKEGREAFERYIKEGTQVSIEGKFIEKLGFPDWWVAWFGDYDRDEARLILAYSPPPEIYPVYVDVITDEGIISQNIELKSIKGGIESVRLSNDHQISPLHLDLTFRKISESIYSYNLNWSLNNWGRDVHEIRQVIKFWRALTIGGKLRITFVTPDNVILPLINFPPQPERAPGSQELKLLDKLCFIQDKTRQFLQLPPEGLTSTDIEAINELAEIIEYGKTTRYGLVTGEFKGEALKIMLAVHRQGKPLHFTISVPETYVELFDLEILTGCMTQHITGTLDVTVAELESAVAALNPDEPLSIKLVNAEVIEVFPDWFKGEAQRLSQLLLRNFGAEAVYLFGSLVWNDIHTPDTDIDLAVSGLPPERYLEAVDYLERESKFPSHLVELDKLPDHLHHRIVTEGKLLNEREPIMAFS